MARDASFSEVLTPLPSSPKRFLLELIILINSALASSL
uniref:Uncharacterized protein n=1 Tax=Myoviridae sp. ctwwN25 TaxID=2825209 RepID=A0A8S5PQ80_9CAUD|nr:MAG TPA: hypothetical protein [Myoviridae sp. ctwwN25]